MRQIVALIFLGLVAACTPARTTETENPENQDQVEIDALRRIGDVRVSWYQKAAIKPNPDGRSIEQPRLLHVLVNKGHSFYREMPDYKMKPEERYLHSADMHDLLVILRDQMGFFNRGNAINVRGDDPVARADREPMTDRIIAVEQIKDGKVNTSYFARRLREDSIDAERARVFNECQALLLDAVSNALPRGSVGDTFDGGRALGRDR